MPNCQTDIHENAYLVCDHAKRQLNRKVCGANEHFSDGECKSGKGRYKRQGVAGSGRVGDFCSFNTDCLTVNFITFIIDFIL
uniref:Uncharacterized protein n=1 Tax=Panagrolaimus davidi TaxID=227884 RepID=A0A914PIE8_9BILA